MTKNSIIKGNWETKTVTINGYVLDPRYSQSVYNHSPDGFNWNYNGSGPAQLALALLLEICTKEDACLYYQEFKRDIIAALPAGDFEMEAEVIFKWLEKIDETKI